MFKQGRRRLFCVLFGAESVSCMQCQIRSGQLCRYSTHLYCRGLRFCYICLSATLCSMQLALSGIPRQYAEHCEQGVVHVPGAAGRSASLQICPQADLPSSTSARALRAGCAFVPRVSAMLMQAPIGRPNSWCGRGRLRQQTTRVCCLRNAGSECTWLAWPTCVSHRHMAYMHGGIVWHVEDFVTLWSFWPLLCTLSVSCCKPATVRKPQCVTRAGIEQANYASDLAAS